MNLRRGGVRPARPKKTHTGQGVSQEFNDYVMTERSPMS